MDIKNNQPTPVRDIMCYESDIWAIADLMLAAGIKQGDFPAYMMPFFALVMLEGRMLNAVREIEEEEGITAAEDPEDFKEAFEAKECGYNEFIVMQGKTLSSITNNDSTFDQDFSNYLKAFDEVLQKLLGIDRPKGEQKYLDIDGMVAVLRAKGILLQVVQQWAAIDLSLYDNSAITTLEEHIKRKWADISAATAGEQYTPDDIISLISEIVAAKISKPKDKLIHVYDPTCGGANLLFGCADRLANEAGYENIATYGSEFNDALYALATIESRFRDNSKIHYGNTLTSAPFSDIDGFDVVVANPPYGVKWKGYEKEVKKDQSGQFPAGYPGINDGQMLFMQHILWKLDDKGIAVEVHNGSTLFDSGNGETAIRKYIFDHDWVEAIIQMPQNEFFNTGIYTYLWIMNKNKPEDRKDKVALIDGSGLWQLLKKAKGDKRREMNPEHRKQIVDALVNFANNGICKIYNREHFYYNNHSIALEEVNDNGVSVSSTICGEDGKHITSALEYVEVDGKRYENFAEVDADAIKKLNSEIAACKLSSIISVRTKAGETYSFIPEAKDMNHTDAEGKSESIGCGCFTLKRASSKKAGTTVTATIAPFVYGDNEIIPHHFDAAENEAEIDAFLAKYVFKPFTKGNNAVGVQINFNKEFYVPEVLEDAEDILAEIAKLEESIAEPMSL